MNDSVRSGLELLGERGEARGADDVIASALARVCRRRSRVRGALVVGVVAVAGVVAAFVVTRDGGESGRELATQATVESEAAPPLDEGPVTLYLSDTLLPRTGGELMVILHNRSSEPAVYALGVELERQAGQSWERVATLPEGGIYQPALAVEPASAGSPERVQIGVLGAGRYRLRKGIELGLGGGGGIDAIGTFDVVDHAVTPVDLAMGGEGFVVTPPLLDRVDGVLPERRLLLVHAVFHSVSPPAEGDSGTVDRFDPGARLYRWHESVWNEVATLDVTPAKGLTDTGRLVDLPADLEPGAYRISREQAGRPTVSGYFFVDDAPADGERETATTLALVDSEVAAPPSDEGAIHLHLSDTVLPASGADLVAVLVNEGSESPTFGVAAALDRWDGTSWQVMTPISTCLDFWFCIAPLDAPVGVRAIGIPARPGSSGPTEWVRVEGLEPGWYRLRKTANEGDVATGTFRVVDADLATVDFGDVTASKLSISPAVHRTACQTASCTVMIDVTINGPEAAKIDPESYETLLDPAARLDRWHGDRWTPAGVLDFSIETVANWPDQPGRRLGRLPDGLTPGAYRVARTTPDGAEIRGVFFVEEAL
jgi:hypothetical protein